MSNTQKGISSLGRFPEWLTKQLSRKGWLLANLAREMAKREGVAESDREDFRRRTKAIHGNISHGLKGKSRLGDDYIKSIADALEADQTEALKEAGRLQVRDKKPTPSKSPAQQKIDALLAILNDEEKEEAISLLETFTKNRKKAKEAASRARTAKT